MIAPPLSLYVHMPWCERKCPYCDFNSHETAAIPEARYIEALIEDLRCDEPYVLDRKIQSIFIGGGTPSLFSDQAIGDLLAAIKSTVVLDKSCEITLEANPGSAEASRFAGYREHGVNRLSLGVQSFDDDKLKTLGRVHSAAQAHAAIEQTLRVGFTNFNIDLMHGLPQQHSADALEDLNSAIQYDPPHLSWYQLTIEQNTAFYRSPPILPDEDRLFDIQSSGESLLSAAGFSNYEVSAYCKNANTSKHNLNYWEFGDYVGLGAGAHSKVTTPSGKIQRYARVRMPNSYLNSRPRQRVCNFSTLSAEALVGDFMLNALRLTNGFSRRLFEQRTELPFDSVAPRISTLIERELLEENDGILRTTELGRRFLDSVVAEFI